jgi:hypothetical protein
MGYLGIIGGTPEPALEPASRAFDRPLVTSRSSCCPVAGPRSVEYGPADADHGVAFEGNAGARVESVGRVDESSGSCAAEVVAVNVPGEARRELADHLVNQVQVALGQRVVVGLLVDDGRGHVPLHLPDGAPAASCP